MNIAAVSRTSASVAALAATLILAGCGGAAHVAPAPGSTASPHTSSITFVVKIPSATASTRRAPRYVSPSTQIIKATVAPAGGGTPATAQNACANGQCSVTILAPIGTDAFTISLYDAQNNLLSTGSTSQTIVEGQTNTVTVVFGGVIATIQLSPAVIGLVKGAPSTTTVAVNALDADGNVIVGPQAAYSTPIALSVNDPTNSVTLSASTVTMPGTSITVQYNGSNSVPATVTIGASATGATGATLTVTSAASGYLYAFAGTLDRYPIGGGTIGPATRLETCDHGSVGNPMDTVGYDGTVYVSHSVCGFNLIETFARGTAAKTVFQTFENRSGPGALDGANHLYVSSGVGIPVYAPPYPDGSTATEIRRVANVANAIAVDSTGALYGIANAGSLSKINVFPPNATGIAAPIRMLNPPGGASFAQLALDPSNNLYVRGSLNGSQAIFVYAPGASGNAIPARVITGPATQLTQFATAIAADASGFVYATSVNSTIVVFAPGAMGNAAPVATTPSAQSSVSVAVDNVGSPAPPPPSGNPAPIAHVTQYALPGSPGPLTSGPDTAIWLTDNSRGVVDRVAATNDPSGPGGVTTFNVPGDPTDITTGSDGALWVLENHANQVVRLTTTGIATQYPFPVANLNAQNIGRGGDGNVWFSTLNPAGVGRVTPAGVVTLFPLPGNDSPGPNFAGAPDGNTYMVLRGTGGDVTRIAQNGTMTIVATLPAPGPICVGPDGNLWVGFGVSEVPPPGGVPFRDQAARIPLAGGSPTLFPLWVTWSTQGSGVGGIAPGPGGRIYASAETAIAAITTAGADVFDSPNINGIGGGVGRLVQGPDGNVWYTDSIVGNLTSTPVLKVLTSP